MLDHSTTYVSDLSWNCLHSQLVFPMANCPVHQSGVWVLFTKIIFTCSYSCYLFCTVQKEEIVNPACICMMWKWMALRMHCVCAHACVKCSWCNWTASSIIPSFLQHEVHRLLDLIVLHFVHGNAIQQMERVWAGTCHLQLHYYTWSPQL